MITRDEANSFLQGHIKDSYHLLHSKMVSFAMEKYAEKMGYDINLHGTLSVGWLKQKDIPEEIIYAIQAHVEHRTGFRPKSELDFALIAYDEICGLIYAYSAIRPEKLYNLKAKSLIKCFNDEKFAAKIDRNLILQGIAGINSDLNQHLSFLATIFNEF